MSQKPDFVNPAQFFWGTIAAVAAAVASAITGLTSIDAWEDASYLEAASEAADALFLFVLTVETIGWSAGERFLWRGPLGLAGALAAAILIVGQSFDFIRGWLT